MNALRRYKEALNNYDYAYKTFQKLSKNHPARDKNIAKILNSIGLNLIDKHKYDDSLMYLKQSLELKKNYLLTNEETMRFQTRVITLVAL